MGQWENNAPCTGGLATCSKYPLDFHVGVMEVSKGCLLVRAGSKCDFAASLLDDLRGPGTSTHAADPLARHKAGSNVRRSIDDAQADDVEGNSRWRGDLCEQETNDNIHASWAQYSGTLRYSRGRVPWN